MDMKAPKPAWINADELVDYEAGVAFMERRVGEIHEGLKPETIWLLEHPPLYTAGTSAQDSDLLDAQFPVFQTGRGGEYTYHGPGQRVAYVMLDLRGRGQDVRGFVWNLEEWVIRTLSEFSVHGERRTERIGVWVVRPDGREEKIAAVGVRVRKWITYHGIAINVAPDLSHYGGIVPCGIPNYGVTSLTALGIEANLQDIDKALKKTFTSVFAG